MRVSIRRSVILACLLACPAFAQKPTKADTREIVVTGNRNLDQQMQEFVEALTEAPPRGQLSRFEWKACPVVIGLSEPQEATVEARMREVAKEVGVPLGGPGCAPNVLVAVTRDRQAFMKDLSKTAPMYLTGLSDRQTQQILREPHATAWHVQGPPLNADGQPLKMVRLEVPTMMTTSDGTPGSFTPPPSESVYLNDTTRPGSRIVASARRHFSAAVVLVDASKITGLSTTQLADYAAMRAFAKTDPARLPSSSPETILKIFDIPIESKLPLSVTHWDVGFLQGLYSSRSDLFAASQRSAIREVLRGQLNSKE